jgi:light-regulated signal transduction histidine kinase (bacteriophytochrome)
LLFQNLITNALKFNTTEAPTVTISAKSEKDCTHFKITDNGIGIKQEHHEKIFDIFQRLHTESEFKGTGIGLAHCRKVVETHNGSIWVDSEFGKGSTFNFTISKSLK